MMFLIFLQTKRNLLIFLLLLEFLIVSVKDDPWSKYGIGNGSGILYFVDDMMLISSIVLPVFCR